MALKYEIDSIEGLDEGVKGLYSKDEASGKYRLGIEGLPEPEDVSGLKSKVQELLDEKKSEAEKRKQAEDAARKAAEEAARKSGDTEALEKSWQEKLAAREAELKAELEKYQGTVVSLTSGQTATKLAAELSVQGSSDVLLPHIERRLKTEYREGQPVTVVLDKDGKPSAMTIDELKKEFSENPAFAPLIVGSKASGAGPHGSKGPGAQRENTEAEAAKKGKDVAGFIKAHLK
jgi:rRNA maturation endonuclease Nob1